MGNTNTLIIVLAAVVVVFVVMSKKKTTTTTSRPAYQPANTGVGYTAAASGLGSALGSFLGSLTHGSASGATPSSSKGLDASAMGHSIDYGGDSSDSRSSAFSDDSLDFGDEAA